VCSSNVTHFIGATFSSCNALAQSNSPPIDSIVLCYLVSAYIQSVFKSVRKSILSIVWLLSFVTVIWSILYLKAWTQVWLIPCSFVFASIYYEFERMQMSAFCQSQEALEHEKLKRVEMAREHAEKEVLLLQLNEIKLKEEVSRIDIEIMELKIKNEVKLKDAESAQLLSLLGNLLITSSFF
jgi:inner membrane protein involved in colicin E2 resistance